MAHPIGRHATVDAADIDAARGTGAARLRRIAGTAGVNDIDGTTGNDTIFGLGGNDLLEGKAGQNTLYGGASADTFYFNADAGKDTIADFNINEPSHDKIALPDNYFGSAMTSFRPPRRLDRYRNFLREQ